MIVILDRFDVIDRLIRSSTVARLSYSHNADQNQGWL